MSRQGAAILIIIVEAHRGRILSYISLFLLFAFQYNEHTLGVQNISMVNKIL
jgi:hypothetical protein